MDPRAALMGTLFALMWSSAFASARIIVAEAPPLGSLSLRFLIAGALAVLIARALGQSWRLPRAQTRAVVLFGLCQNALYLGLNFVALQRVEAGLAAIIASSMPLMVAALGWALRGQRVSALGLAGLLAGLAGTGLILGTRLQGGADPAGLVMCIGGALALAIATLTLTSAAPSGNLLMVVGLQMLVGAAALGAAALALEPPRLSTSAAFVLAMAYQILIPGLAATLIWFWLVARIGAVRASAFHFLNPFFGVAVGAALLDERVTPLDMLGVAIAASGILAVQISRMKT
ncbi:MAG: DMT family transporter [Paracoccaceae bacterium]